MISKLKHILEAAAVGGGVAFLQTIEALGGQDFGAQPWWAIAAAVLTFGITELTELERKS